VIQAVTSSPPLAALVCAAALMAVGLMLPDWVLFTASLALAKGLVVLGLVLLLRMGAVSFGQGMYYCLGAYICGLVGNATGVQDALFLVILSGLGCCVLGAVLGVFLSAYRGVFFAMFNLALSMILYGALLKATSVGGSDGIGIAPPSYFGLSPSDEYRSILFYAFVVVVAAVVGLATRIYMRSELGLAALAVRDNEIRLEYLGLSVRRVIVFNYAIAAGLAGLGGGLVALVSGHIIPEFAYWTTSGEFVFMTVLSGPSSIIAAFGATALFETVRLVAGQYLPNAWQLMLGAFLLLSILFLPNGIGALAAGRRRTDAEAPDDPPPSAAGDGAETPNAKEDAR